MYDRQILRSLIEAANSVGEAASLQLVEAALSAKSHALAEALAEAPRITAEMIHDSTGLNSIKILRSGWCANPNCGKHWYAVVFLANKRVWWGEIRTGDKHPTCGDRGKESEYKKVLAKFDKPGDWKQEIVGKKIANEASLEQEKLDEVLGSLGAQKSHLTITQRIAKKEYDLAKMMRDRVDDYALWFDSTNSAIKRVVKAYENCKRLGIPGFV